MHIRRHVLRRVMWDSHPLKPQLASIGDDEVECAGIAQKFPHPVVPALASLQYAL